MESLLSTFISYVFIIISNIVNSFMTPFINIIISLYPSATSFFDNVYNFLVVAVTYVGCIYRWFLFTPAMFSMLFTYFIGKFGIWVIANTVRATVRFYKWFKP